MLIPLDHLVRQYQVRPNGILHVGAHLAEEAQDYARHNIENVIWVECHSEALSLLQPIIKNNKGHRLVCAAASESDDVDVKFYKTSNRMSSSLLQLHKHLEKHPDVVAAGTETVRTITIDSLFKRNGLNREVYDFLNMDIQGAELMALRGASEYLKSCRWVYTEINTEELYKGCAMFSDLNKFLEERGFKLVEKRMSSEFNAWGDAFYARA